MTNEKTKEIERILFENRDGEYAKFQAKLMPNVSAEHIIGVRIPVLRSISKRLAKDKDIGEFLADLPHKYYDTNNLHGFIICECGDYDDTIKHIDALLPYVDNWATCDLLNPRSFKKNRNRLIGDIDRWIASDETYTIRFGIGMLMSHYLDGDFKTAYPEKVAAIKSEEYYVNMMRAWYFATALVKQWKASVPYMEKHRLDKWTHNKAIQKAVESRRITAEQKMYLRTLKRK